jgi:hypothetical protein
MRVFITNASSRKPPRRGPGRVWTIMAAPREEYGEGGDGQVPALVPELAWVRGVKDGSLSMHAYCVRYLEALDWPELAPGRLVAREGPNTRSVADGDTLICCCSVAKAGAGLCHRAWVAYGLRAAGWDVVLDGELLDGTGPNWPELWHPDPEEQP